MSDIIYNNDGMAVGGLNEKMDSLLFSESQISPEYVVSRIEKIISDTEHIRNAIGALSSLNTNDTDEDVAVAKAEALVSVVKCRETTNQQLIRLLEKIYDDLRPDKPSGDVKRLQELAGVLSGYPHELASEIIRKSAQQMFVKAGAPIV